MPSDHRRAAAGQGSVGGGDDDVFVYTGQPLEKIPRDVRFVRVDPSVRKIDDEAFCGCKKLESVELHEGLMEIGENAFRGCDILQHVKIPSTVRRIGRHAFFDCYSLMSLRLPDGVEVIDGGAFYCCMGLTNFRVPPLINAIKRCFFERCPALFSIELPENVAEIEGFAFDWCRSLRNIAIPVNTGVGGIMAFFKCSDFQKLFGSDEQIINALTGEHIIDELKHRFDGLPIHKMFYYQSYQQPPVTLDQLKEATSLEDTTGNAQDCLGMTPLHILACSTVQDLSFYQLMVERFPGNLVTEDRWGALPILYAVWGEAPREVVDFLLERYRSMHPNYTLDWDEMLITLGRIEVPLRVIKNLLDAKQAHFTSQNIDWGRIIESVENDEVWIVMPSFQFIVRCGIAPRFNAIGVKQWRDDVLKAKTDDEFKVKRTYRQRVEARLSHYEAAYQTLKEATTILELAIWKAKMDQSATDALEEMENEKRRGDDAELRKQFRISCGSNVVIRNVVPYLLHLAGFYGV